MSAPTGLFGLHLERPGPRRGWREVAVAAALAYAALTLALLAVGGLVVGVMQGGLVGEAERAVTTWVVDHRVPVLDAVAAVGSSITDTWTVVGVGIGASTTLLATGHLRRLAALVVALGLDLTVFLTVAVLVDRPRPDVPVPGPVPPTAGFPSGHAAAALALYGGLALVAMSLVRDPTVHRVARGLTVVVALLVAASRVYEGLHFTLDSVAGTALGVGVLVATVRVARRLPLDDPDDALDGRQPSPSTPVGHDTPVEPRPQ